VKKYHLWAFAALMVGSIPMGYYGIRLLATGHSHMDSNTKMVVSLVCFVLGVVVMALIIEHHEPSRDASKQTTTMK